MFSIETLNKVNTQSLFLFEQSSNKIVSIFCDTEDSVVVFFDEELPSSKTFEVRADGIWSEVVREIENEHWSLSMESFALRMSIQEFKEQGLYQNMIGERIPYGYDLDCEFENSNWLLSGNIIVGRTEFAIEGEEIILRS